MNDRLPRPSPRVLQAGRHTFDLAPGAPVMMGIVNTNAGSFSDRTAPGSVDNLVQRAVTMVEDGAGVIDIGFDSGVTYNEPIPVQEQIRRGIPLVERLVALGVPVSLDTPNPEVARAGLDAGACLLNDVSGLAEPAFLDLAVEYSAALCLLHTRAPHKVEHFPVYDDVVADVAGFLAQLTERALAAGVESSQLVLDPGFDYAKRPHETVDVIRGVAELEPLDRPYLFGISRKYFAGVLTGAPPAERLPETLATLAYLKDWPAIMRVHDVGAAQRFISVLRVLEEGQFPDYDQLDDGLKWVRA